MSKNKSFILWISLLYLCILLNTNGNAQCNSTTYSTNEKDSWLSCQTSINPNSQRGTSHWLQYDLGYVYQMGATQFWNYNVTNLTGRGFKEIAIDYSLDGSTWHAAGTFQLPEATGIANYTGNTGLDLTGISTRFILLTAISNWNDGNCAGLSEVRFEVSKSSANCGNFIVTQNISGNSIRKGTYYADNPIESDAGISLDSVVTFQSGTLITLKDGFFAEQGSQFTAKIATCEQFSNEEKLESRTVELVRIEEERPSLTLFPNPTTNVLNIVIDQTTIQELMIINASGHELLRRNGAQNLSQIDVSILPTGIYMLSVLTKDEQIITKRFIKY